MPKFKMLVLSNAVDARDEEFNRWYDEVHLRDVFRVPGVTGAERYRMRSGKGWKYLAIYELECDDPAAVERELMARAGTDAMQMTDAFDMQSFYMGLAELITPFRAA
ncbi:hypothetical protein [Blastomonas sp.]|uniref:hypothetical protein n=1 Tax=Blastomonas sp. TaxID=1909299 RepID=UPI00406A6872